MNRHSLSSRISAIFGISFALVCLLFLLLDNMQTQRALEVMQQRQFQAVNYLFQLHQNNTPPKDIEAYFRHFGLKQVSNRNLMAAVLEKGEVTFHRTTSLGSLSSIVYNKRYYLLLDNPAVRVVFENQNIKHTDDFLWIALALALAVLVSIYVSVMRSIYPLKPLSQSIRRFASGDMDITCKSDKKDEIAEVANEFDRAVKKIRDLIRSRQLFLRTIMHELKTPIGKGRIVAEMVKGDVQKKRLVGIFERLDLLINEFSKIEQLVSKSYSVNLQECPLSLVVEQGCDLLMLDEVQMQERLHVNLCHDFLVKADFELLALAIKNLIDNALKYSSDKKVAVTTTEKGLRISNHGPALKHSIEHYCEAFVTTAEQTKNGMGLGLYIVTNILALHGMKMAYTYENGTHYFDLLLGKNSGI
ncbi:HAMP domain-containing histidine kinase [Sulfurospirillum sp. T05]|uniref:histidine kinase n=1 Tax=Sulfurospirillum tamanense TaxID=2813362 RepID=A0ABS2WPM4_9BACT|nr:ArsS family sensor histidine kinase [Sulfurospirillum tamanensis]MBN2963657.1 HAMP domain-containing histidine kinase [Sulfurospirillum tamanensis]